MCQFTLYDWTRKEEYGRSSTYFITKHLLVDQSHAILNLGLRHPTDEFPFYTFMRCCCVRGSNHFSDDSISFGRGCLDVLSPL